MSVVGIDFGTQNTVVAVARHRSIDVITNEVSNRLTPTMITLEKLSNGTLKRYLGEASKTVEISKLPFTVTQLKRIVMMAAGDQVSMNQSDLNAFQNVFNLDMKTGSIDSVANAVQIIAMFFGRIKEITQAAISSHVSDCVIGVPGYWGDAHRRILQDAASVAGLKPLLLMAEGTAAALAYGFSRIDSITDGLQLVIVDIGHSMTQVQMSSLSSSGLTVVSRTCDASLGGRDIDSALARHLAARLETERPKVFAGLSSSHKAMARLRAACEKAKKMLSASSIAPLSVESLFNDADLSITMTRDELIQIMESEGFFERLRSVLAPITAAVVNDGPKLHIEIVGGTTRIPAIKELISLQFSGHPISLGLNQDEAIARGCAYQCAILSPVFKVRPFEVKEICSVPYTLNLVSASGENHEVVTLLETGTVLPASRVVTVSCNQLPIKIELVSDDFVHASYLLELEEQPTLLQSVGNDAVVKIKARCNASGIFSFEEKASVWARKESVESSEAAVMAKTEFSALLTSVFNYGTSKTEIERLISMEASMAAADAALTAAETARNNVETFIYEMRDALSFSLAPFIEKEEEEKQLTSALLDAEQWLESLPVSFEDLGDCGMTITDITMSAEKKLCLLKDSFSFVLDRLRQYETAEDQLTRVRREASRLGLDGGDFEPRAPYTAQVIAEVQRLEELIAAEQAKQIPKQAEETQNKSSDTPQEETGNTQCDRQEKTACSEDIHTEPIPASDLD